jgi:uncharacterized YigZ family protein
LSYQTVAQAATQELTVMRSVFIARVRETRDEAEARELIAEARAADPQANHHCYAYRLGQEAQERTHSNDAGEPGGTAGRPILGTLLAAGVTNATIVVSRYFGGKKLGIPGLIEAYRSAAQAVLEAAGTIIRVPSVTIGLRLPYSQLETVRRLAGIWQAKELTADYGLEVTLILRLARAAQDPFLERLLDLGLTPVSIAPEGE